MYSKTGVKNTDEAQVKSFLIEGLSFLHKGKMAQAKTLFEQALHIQPKSFDALNLLGFVAALTKNYLLAAELFGQAIFINQNNSGTLSNYANVLKELKRFDEALASYDQAIKLKVDYPEAYFNRGITLGELNRFDEALASFDQAIKFKVDYADAYVSRGNALKELRRFDDALASYDQAIKLKVDYTEAYINRGIVLEGCKRFDEASASYKSALSLRPDYEFLLSMVIRINMQICNWDGITEKISLYEADILKRKAITEPFVALTLLDKPDLHKMTSEAYTKTFFKRKQTPDLISTHRIDGKIRIGYYSADFHNHATSYLMAELFELHDARKFELYGFSFGLRPKDEMGERVSVAFNKFFDVSFTSDREVAILSRQLGIDIAVDLKGYTKDNRMGIFAERCAPIQVSYLGYPGTLGADYIDYVIADKTVLPESSQDHFTEKVVYLPHSYQVNDSKRKISDRVFTKAELGLPLKGFIFCCFNNNYKIFPATFDSWMRILKAVEGSVLWLLEDNKTAASNLRKEAQARGVEISRLVFVKRIKLDEHLARHRLADLFLDTLPYNAHTTASDALWAGLPVLTCTGRSFPSRVAGSLLNAVELPELVTQTQEEYEARAIELATHPSIMQKLRRKLERNRITTPLFNGKLFAKHIESAYVAMHERAQAGLPTEHIEIKPII